MSQTISKPQAVLKQARPLARVFRTGRSNYSNHFEGCQTIFERIRSSQIVNLAKNKNKLLNVNRAVAKADPRHKTLVCL